MSFLFPGGAGAAPPGAPPPGTGPPGPPPVVFNVETEIAKIQAKQFALFVGQASLLLCVCTTAMCLLRPRGKATYYVDSDDEEEENDTERSASS